MARLMATLLQVFEVLFFSLLDLLDIVAGEHDSKLI